MKRVVTLVLAAALGGGLAFAAVAAGNMNREIATALIHANVARQIDTVAGVHLHLHHVLNCVLGRDSKQYSATAEAKSAYKCAGLGDGALPDAGHDQPVRSDLERAVRAAESGIAANRLAVAHKQADAVVVALEAAQRASK